MVEANPSNQDFLPDKKMFIIIGNIAYDKLRELKVDGVNIFLEPNLPADINEASADLENVKMGVISCFGAREDEIKLIKNIDKKSFERTLRSVMHQVDVNSSQGKKTFIFLYFAGHAEMDNFTNALLNADNKENYRFQLETQLRALGRIEDAFVISIFDCCRSRVHKALRNLKGSHDDEEKSYQNFFFSFGCPPNGGVDLASTIAVQWFAKFKELCI